jgi:hypothetical protein
MNDFIVDEVRKARAVHTRKCGGDLNAIAEDMRRIQKECGHKVVRLDPKRMPELRRRTA